MGGMKLLLIAGLLCAITSSPVEAAWSEVVNLDDASVAAPLSFKPEFFVVSEIALADKSQAANNGVTLPIVHSPQVTGASHTGLPVRAGSVLVDANSDFARLRQDHITAGNLPISSFGFSPRNGLGGAYDNIDMRRIPGGGLSIVAIIGLLGYGLLISGLDLGRQRMPRAPSSGRSYTDADLIGSLPAPAISDMMMSINGVIRPQDAMGGSSYWDTNSLVPLIVYAAEPMIANVRSDGHFDHATMPVADFDAGMAAVVQYRMFTLDLRAVRSFRDFIAANDSAALDQARLCEPTEAFELWRGNVCVTWQPQIQ
jgi:hypothetical protein